jgi:uncharacterized protein (DUF58 family)
MRRLFLLSAVLFALVFAGLFSFDQRLLVLALPYAVYLVVGLVSRGPVGTVDIRHSSGQARLDAGVPVVVDVTVANHGPAIEEARIESLLPAGVEKVEGDLVHRLFLAQGQRVTWQVTLRGRRGVYPLAPSRLVAGDVFGLASQEHRHPPQGQLIVLPRIGGPGVEFFGLREYQSGDPLHWINWRASQGSEGTLYTNEYQQERMADIGLVLDGRSRTNQICGDQSLLDYSTTAAATLATGYLSQGNRVSLLVYGEYLQWTLPGYGRLQSERILRVLARVQPGQSEVFADLDHIPTRLFPAQSQVILISPLTEDDPGVLLKLRSHGYQVLVITPDPVSFEVAMLPKNQSIEMAGRILRMERHLMLRRLQHAGIQVIEWDVAQSFDQVMRSQPSRPVFDPLWRGR